MKNFVKENWYKLMIGSSMMMASFGFMIYAISPAYSNSDKEKTEIKNTGIPNAPVGTGGWDDGKYAYFVDAGYIYRFNRNNCNNALETWKGTEKGWDDKPIWEKSKLP